MNAIKRIIHECNKSSTVDAFPSLEGLSFCGMRAIKEWSLEKQPDKWMQCLRKLDVLDCPKLQVLPPVPVGVKELSFKDLGLYVLPNLWNDQSSKSGSLPALVVVSISCCQNLVSLTEGLLQSPERFVALEELNINYCEKLMNLPPGGFNKFISLRELNICFCQKIDGILVQECFLPSGLQKLSISSCGHLDTILPKALENLHSLIELELSDCTNITSLPPKEVFSRWKTLKKLILKNCPVLASLESLFGLSFIEYLKVLGCPKLSPAIPFPLALKKDETKWKEKGTIQMQTSDQNDEFNKWFVACSRRALTFFLSLLYTLVYLVLRMFMLKLKKSVSAQSQPPSPSSTMETGETSAQEKPMLSVGVLVIDDPLLLSIEPIRSLHAVRKLTIEDCSKLQSLPQLPPILQELYLRMCCCELRWRCMRSGPDWPKLSQIPKVIIGDHTGTLATFLKNDFEAS